MIQLSKPFIGPEEKAEVLAVLDSGYIVQGPRTQKLEELFAEACGVSHAVATSNGTTALHLALLAHGIGPGDEVITTPFTFTATANSILMVGATPVFVDVEADTFNLDATLVEDAITAKTKAIMPVHLYGQMCDMDALEKIATKHSLVIIEDSAQAVGATYRGKKAGSIGTGTFSLYATKNIMSAEGGMITTNDEAIAEKCRLLRNHGQSQRYHHDMLGYNFRMSDLHAAIGLCQIKRLSAYTARRQANAEYFNASIESVITPITKEGRGHVWHQYTIRVNSGRSRDEAVAQLTEAGIGAAIFYPVPGYRPEYMRAVVGDITLPVVEKLTQEVLSIPVHPHLSQSDLEQIVDEVNKL